MKIKKLTIMIIVAFIAHMMVTPMVSRLQAQTFDFDAEAVFLMEAETGRVLYEYNGDEALPPASLTKIMTLILGLESLEEGTIQPDEEALTSTKARQMGEGGSRMFLEENQRVSIMDLLTGIAVVSANDGSIVLAEHMHGSVDGFVREMNQKAQEIGLENTRFTDPVGLDHPDQYMSARDTALLSQYAIQHTPKILELESIPEFQFNIDWPQENRNKMLPERNTPFSYEGTDGLKTGRTREAGYNFVGTSEQNGMRLIAVVLGTPDEGRPDDENLRFKITETLFNYGFTEFEKITLLEAGQEIGTAPVEMGQEREVSIVSPKDYPVVTQVGQLEELQKEVVLEEDTLEAPIEEGERIGQLIIVEEGEEIGRADISAGESVDRLGFFGRIFRTITDSISGLYHNVRESIVDLIFGD